MPEQDSSQSPDADDTVRRNGDATGFGPSETTPSTGGGRQPEGTPPDLDDLLSALTSRFSEVAARMSRAADAMRGEGTLPDYRLVEALGDCHRELLRFRRVVHQHLESLGHPVPTPDQPAGLRDLQALIAGVSRREGFTGQAATGRSLPRASSAPVGTPDEVSVPVFAEEALRDTEATADGPITVESPSVVAAPGSGSVLVPEGSIATGRIGEVAAATIPTPAVAPDVPEPGEHDVSAEEVRRDALHVLAKALRITVPDGGKLPALHECRVQARSLVEALRDCEAVDLPPEAFGLASGGHPLARLVLAVESPDGLTDSEWADLHAVVSESFGRAIAVALARHRLTIDPEG
jgi:hypothetical protein